jgi:VCBS repeat-containing protein
LNYAGKFDATFPSEGPGTHSHAYAHVDSSQTHAPADAIIVPDAQLLFHAHFSRSGTDLILSKDHHEYVVHDYFTGEKRAPLASPDGAHLTADIVKALVGEVEVSQAGTAPAASQVIGHVTKLQGSATVIRNGVSIILNMGDNVEKGDVVESGASSTVGITFIDGTVFGLSSNARMVLNEMVYDPNGSNNSSLMSLVAGTITFVAGETAKHGDMKIDTPVATMGIRGTAVLVEIDFTVPGQSGQPNASFQVLVEPDGTTGSYILFDKNTLQPIAIVNQAGQQININNGIINITTNPLSPDLQKLITDVFQQKFTDNSTNTKSTSPSTDSIIPTSSPLIIKTAEAIITAQTVNVQSSSAPPPPTTQSDSIHHVAQDPIVHISTLLGVETAHFLASGELSGLTGSPLPDAAVGIVSFNDINVGDHPTVSAALSSFTFTNAHRQDVTGGLSALQLADIAATEVKLTITPFANNTNIGSAFFSYSIADQSFDFLAAGEQITLTYVITVTDNYTPAPDIVNIPITITITGTNDVPVITTSAQTIAFTPSGTKTVGGDLQTKNATSGTLAFTDVDLTDTHTVATKLTSAVMSDGSTVPPLPESVFEAALRGDRCRQHRHGRRDDQLAALGAAGLSLGLHSARPEADADLHHHGDGFARSDLDPDGHGHHHRQQRSRGGLDPHHDRRPRQSLDDREQLGNWNRPNLFQRRHHHHRPVASQHAGLSGDDRWDDECDRQLGDDERFRQPAARAGYREGRLAHYNRCALDERRFHPPQCRNGERRRHDRIAGFG